MKIFTNLLLLFILISITACQSDTKPKVNTDENQKVRISIDKKAQELVTASFDAMGGKDKYDDLNIVSWTFFGSRHLVWDKNGSRVRIDSPKDTSVYLLNLHDKTGRVIKGGKEVTDKEELASLIKRAEGIWINDSYWLVMPWKLNDNGVNLKYVRQDTTLAGAKAEVLELTFDNVGNTPENKYEVYIDQSDHMIKQWAFFKTADQETHPRIWPWDNYQSHNGLLLSSDRSDKSGPSNVRTYDKLDDKVFTSFETFDYF